jgi:hypothetical protein
MTMTDVVEELKSDAEMAQVLTAYDQYREDAKLQLGASDKEAGERAYLRCCAEYGRVRVLAIIERMREKRNAT